MLHLLTQDDYGVMGASSTATGAMPTPQFERLTSPARFYFAVETNGGFPAYGVGSGASTVGLVPNVILNVANFPVLVDLVNIVNKLYGTKKHIYNGVSLLLYFGKCMLCLSSPMQGACKHRNHKINPHQDVNYKGNLKKSSQVPYTDVVTITVGDARTFYTYAEKPNGHGRDYDSKMKLDDGSINILHYKDEMAGKYHSVEMEGDAGLSAAFVVRCIGNDTIRKVDKNNHMELTPEEKERLNRKSKSFTNRIDQKRGGSHFQKCFNMEYQHGMPTKSINEVLEYNKKYWVERDLPILKANLKVWVKNELTTSKNWKV